MSDWKQLSRLGLQISPLMILNKNFREFIELLEKHHVEYLVVGGYAVGFHGFPRYTGDLDFFVALSEKNAAALVSVFAEFGFADIGLKESDFLEPETVVEIGREPLKIQVLTGIDGVQFDACYKGKVVFESDNLKIPFISMPDLIANKTASPRGKDKIDLDELLKIAKSKSSE